MAALAWCDDAPGAQALRARSAIDGLPPESQVELRRMFKSYAEAVNRRLEQGWRPGVLDESVIEDVERPFQPARLLEQALKNRPKEIAQLEDALRSLTPDHPDYARNRRLADGKKLELGELRRKAKREKGVCRDWSDESWAALRAAKPQRWRIEDRRREARPYHSAAVACSKDVPRLCLAFDPWSEGKPDVFAFGAWDENQTRGARLPPAYFLHGLPEKAP